jgi:two-component system chemotaxis sensor kinase CheA
VSDAPSRFDFAALVATFLGESRERLDQLEENVLGLSDRPDDKPLLHEAFRATHTLKGDGATVGYGGLSQVAHDAEELLHRAREGQLQLDAGATALLLEAVDVMRRLLAAPADIDLPEVGRLRRRFQDFLTSEPSARAPTPGVVASADAARRGAAVAASLRIPVDRLDRLLDLVGEMTVARERLREELAALSRSGVTGAGALLDEYSDTDRIHRELQALILQARLVAVAPVLRSYRRLVKETSEQCGKRARLEIEDQGVELDARILEALRAPLSHIVRNAIDHGIESPEARLAAGKPEEGRVLVRTELAAGSVLLQISDDGAGIRYDKVAARARSLGLLDEGRVATEEELRQFLLVPGFSTVEQVTEVSGRGVGLDAVEQAVEGLRGSMELEARPGVGLTVSLRLPLTLSILDGFQVRVGEETYILPIATVLECLELPDSQRRSAAPRGVLELRGEAVPFLRLGAALGVPHSDGEREVAVVVRIPGGRAGLVVDELIGGGQNVVKTLGAGIRRVPGIHGSTILGSGRVALILDVPSLLQRVVHGEVSAA